MMTDKATPLTVCLIDDDAIYQFTAKKIIELVNPEQRVLSFTNGQQAINYLSQHNMHSDKLPDIIFLDINMPVMDGWEFLDAYQKVFEEVDKKIPIYMVSSSVDENDVYRSRSYTIVKDFLIKPMNREIMMDILSSPISN